MIETQRRGEEYLNLIGKKYIYVMFIYISFEPIILNLVNMLSVSLVAFVRYGMEVVGYLLLFVIVLAKRKIVLRKSRFNRFVILTIVVSSVTSIINLVEPDIFIIGFRYLLRYLYVYILIQICGWSINEVKSFYKLLEKVMIVEIILVLWQIIHRSSADAILLPQYGNILEGFNSVINVTSSKLAVYGSFGRYNLLGYFATVAIWYWIAQYEFRNNKKRVSGMLLIWVIVLVVSFSRQTIVGVAIAFFIYLAGRKKLKIRHMLIIILCGVVMSILVYNAAVNFTIGINYEVTGVGGVNGNTFERYVSMFSLDFLKIDYEGKGRTWFLTEGIKRLVDSKPLLGFGIGMYGCPDTLRLNSYVYDLLHIPKTYYMDVYIGCIIGQIGLIGFMTYIAIYLINLSNCRKLFNCSEVTYEVKVLSLINYGVVLSALVMMCFSSSLCNRVMALYLWMFMGWQNSINKYEKI